MTAPARFRQADVTRMLKAALKAGLENVRVDIEPSGRLTLLSGKLAANDQQNPWDEGPDQ